MAVITSKVVQVPEMVQSVCVVTITTSGTGALVVIINNVSYNSAATVEVDIGTVIYFNTYNYQTLYIDGIKTTPNDTAQHKYTVTSNVSIHANPGLGRIDVTTT